MKVLLLILTIFFIFSCALLVLIVMLQSDKNSGMGAIGGSSQSTFGSSTADVVTKITAVLVAIFLIGSLGISVLQSYIESSKSIQSESNIDKG